MLDDFSLFLLLMSGGIFLLQVASAIVICTKSIWKRMRNS